MLRVLVTGANGWIGRALLEHLVSEGISKPLAGVRRYDDDLPFEQCEFGDLSSASWDEGLLQGVDMVVHAAGRAHVMHETAADPLDAFRQANVVATQRLLQAAAKAGVRRFVYLSSIKVNGEQSPVGRGFSETDKPCPQDAYALSKWEAEQKIIDFCQAHSMEWVIVRPPLVYGVGVKANFLQLARKLSQGWPLPLGALHNLRSMVALDNLTSFLGACVLKPEACGQLFLISDGQDLSVAQMARTLAVASGQRGWLLPVPGACLSALLRCLGRAQTAERLCAELRVDSRKAQQRMAWQPKYSPEQALSQVAQALKKTGD